MKRIEKRVSGILNKVKRIESAIKRGITLEPINKRVRRILKQETDANRLDYKLDDEDYLELMDINEDVDIAEDHSRASALEDLIAANIEFLLKREGFNATGSRFTIENFKEAGPQDATDTVMGSWIGFFADGSEFVGNCIADGMLDQSGIFTLNSIYVGNRRLSYFGP